MIGTSLAAEPVAPAMATDANIVTAIDVSDSVGRHEEWLQQKGLVQAIVHPDFLRAATSGPRRRIGLAVFSWSSHGKFEVLIPWTIIGSAEDAARVSRALASVKLIDRTHYGGGSDQRRDDAEVVIPDRLTDISGAIDFASRLLTSGPYATSRAVMNICANGIDNFGGGPEASRDSALAQGLTINGLVLGENARLARYFRASVIGGPGAFVMEMSGPEDAGQFMTRKLVRDLRTTSSAMGLP